MIFAACRGHSRRLRDFTVGPIRKVLTITGSHVAMRFDWPAETGKDFDSYFSRFLIPKNATLHLNGRTLKRCPVKHSIETQLTTEICSAENHNWQSGSLGGFWGLWGQCCDRLLTSADAGFGHEPNHSTLPIQLILQAEGQWGSIMRIRYGRSRLSDIFAKWLRTYIVDECPEARKERIAQDAIDALKANIALLEAMCRWERENEARLCDERQTQAKPPSLLPRAAARQTI